jgi:hypothetical protein
VIVGLAPETLHPVGIRTHDHNLSVYGDMASTLSKVVTADPDFVMGHVVTKSYEVFGKFFFYWDQRYHSS